MVPITAQCDQCVWKRLELNYAAHVEASRWRVCAAKLLFCYSIMARCFAFAAAQRILFNQKKETGDIWANVIKMMLTTTATFLKGLMDYGKRVMLISRAGTRLWCRSPGAPVPYLTLSSSALFSSASLLSTVMMAPCSSSVRWLRSIMAPRPRPPASLSRNVQ